MSWPTICYKTRSLDVHLGLAVKCLKQKPFRCARKMLLKLKMRMHPSCVRSAIWGRSLQSGGAPKCSIPKGAYADAVDEDMKLCSTSAHIHSYLCEHQRRAELA